MTTTLAPPSSFPLPPALAGMGDEAATAFVDFFAAQIRNANTRAAYARAVGRFLSWLDEQGTPLKHTQPVLVAGYTEQLAGSASTATV